LLTEAKSKWLVVWLIEKATGHFQEAPSDGPGSFIASVPTSISALKAATSLFRLQQTHQQFALPFYPFYVHEPLCKFIAEEMVAWQSEHEKKTGKTLTAGTPLGLTRALTRNPGTHFRCFLCVRYSPRSRCSAKPC
jgi:hypothetical protein